MCGIAGYWYRGNDSSHVVDHSVLQRMARSLAHRGPDDEGVVESGRYGAAHARLSVLDPSSAARQPAVSDDGRYILVFNGEIYNYRELQQNYLDDWTSASSSDTYVLLELLIRKNTDILSELKGMFAFAFWDSVEQELLLARDPFGKKPLYTAVVGDVFAYASEPKALFEHPDIVPACDSVGAVKAAAYEYIPGPASGYRDVYELPMGHCMTVTKDTVRIRQWWRVDMHPKRDISETKALATLDDLLMQAVERRLVSDVPVGVFLSGGLDSTAIAWYMKQAGAQDFHSCSVSFDVASFDESSYARRAAEDLGIEHHDVRFTLDTFHECIDEVFSGMDIPLGDASLLPTYAVSKEAKRFMTVVLDGDGSDELFGGYGTFRAADIAERMPNGFISFWRTLYAMSQLLPVSHRYFSLDFKVKSFLRGLGYPLAVRNQRWLGSFTPEECEQLFTKPYAKYIRRIYEDTTALTPELDHLDTFDGVSYITLHHYLHNDILVKLDRATMAVGLEARTPFLDVDLAEFIMRLPSDMKRDKRLLKRLMRGRISDDIIDRPKKGFGVPLGMWFQNELYEWVRDVLREDTIREDGIFEYAYIDRMMHRHKTRRGDYRKQLWTLIAFQLWHDHWIVGRRSTHTPAH